MQVISPLLDANNMFAHKMTVDDHRLGFCRPSIRVCWIQMK